MINRLFQWLFKGVFALGLLIFCLSCQSNKGDQIEENDDISSTEEILLSDEQVKLAEIQYGKLKQMSLSEEIRCNGIVTVPPQSLVSISLPMDGYVKEINVQEGKQVRKGDLLAVMQHPDFLKLQENYIVSRNDLVMLKEDLSRQEILAREDAASAKKLTEARTNYENIHIQHTSIGEQLRMMGINPLTINFRNLSSEVRIYSPINGFVRENYANTGLLIHAGAPIVELEDNSNLYAHLSVYERDISMVEEGQEVEFETASGDKVFSGKIYAVGKTIVNENQAADVLVKISNPDDNLLSGMYVKARIFTGQTDVYALPESGITLLGGNKYVYMRDDNSFRRIQVKTGISFKGFVEIKSPENLLEKELVTQGAYYLNASYGEEE